MSRKSRSFSQLYDYMNRDDGMVGFMPWNLRPVENREQVLEQFYENSDLLRTHAKGNVLYHEIISLKFYSEVPLQRQMQALQDLTRQYLSIRAPHLLGYGRIHLEQGHLHVHLMLSSNELNQARRFRLSKGSYREIQQRCEQYLHEVYPDLKQPIIYDRSRARAQSPENAQEKPLSHEELRRILEDILKETNPQDLESVLKEKGFVLYRRGRTPGVEHHGKRYRFSTLGLDGDRFFTPSRASEFTESEIDKEMTRLEDLEAYYTEAEESNPEIHPTE